jgi:hypothetical protein
MNAKEARKNVMKISCPPIEQETQEVLYIIENFSRFGQTNYWGKLSNEQMNNRKYRKAFKKFFKDRGFKFVYRIAPRGTYTIYW